MPQVSQDLLTRVNAAAERVLKAFTLHQISDELWSMSSAAGTNNLNFSAVETGRIAIITAVSAVDVDSSPSLVQIGPMSGGSLQKHKSRTSPIANESTVFAGQLILAEGEYIRIHFEGVTSGDDLYGFINGYWIEL